MPNRIHLTVEDTNLINDCRKKGDTLEQIAKRLNVNKNTINRHMREVKLHFLTKDDPTKDSSDLDFRLRQRFSRGEDELTAFDPISWIPLLNVILSIHFYRPNHPG